MSVVVAGLALAAAGALAQAPELFQRLATYQLSGSREPVSTVETLARTGTPEQRQAVEKGVLSVLADPQATADGKSICCRLLREIGSPASVPVLAALLTDPRLTHMARFALQSIPGPEAGAALRDALGRTQGEIRIGVIGSIGARGDGAAVPALLALAAGDTPSGEAAMRALGRIGGEPALAGLVKLGKPADAVRAAAWGDGVLASADKLAAQGASPAALAAFRLLYDPALPAAVRLAALRGQIELNPAGGAAEIVRILGADDPLRAQVPGIVRALQSPVALEHLRKAIPQLPPAGQADLLLAIAARADGEALTEAVGLATSEHAAVRAAAIEVLAAEGAGAQAASTLLQLALDGADKDAARAALIRKPGGGTDQALIGGLRNPEPSVRTLAAEVLAERSAAAAVPALMEMARDADSKIRVAALKALRKLAGPDDVKPLVSMLPAAKDETDAGYMVQALSAAIVRLPDPGAAADILATVPAQSTALKAELMPLLARAGGAKSLALIGGWTKDGDAETRRAAVRALGQWPDDEALAILWPMAEAGEDQDLRVLALRGCIRVVEARKKRPAGEAVKLYDRALKAARRPEEKTQVLSALGGMDSAAALKLAAAMLDDPALAEPAAAAVLQVAGRLKPGVDAGVKSVLQKLAAGGPTNMKTQADRQLKRLTQ